MAEDRPLAERLIDALVSFQEKMWPEVDPNALKEAEGRKAVLYISGADGAVITCQFTGARFTKVQDAHDARNLIYTDLDTFLDLVLDKISLGQAIAHSRLMVKTKDGRIATQDIQLFQLAWTMLKKTAAAMRLTDRIRLVVGA